MVTLPPSYICQKESLFFNLIFILLYNFFVVEYIIVFGKSVCHKFIKNQNLFHNNKSFSAYAITLYKQNILSLKLNHLLKINIKS